MTKAYLLFIDILIHTLINVHPNHLTKGLKLNKLSEAIKISDLVQQIDH